MWAICRWMRARAANRHSSITVRIYSKPECHLCDQAHEFLRAEQRRLGFHLDYVDINSSDELTKQFAACVPVIEVNGRTFFRGRINPVLWKRLMRATGRRRPA